MNQNDIEEIVNAFLDERLMMSHSDHSLHHQWIQTAIEAEKAKKQIYLEMAKTVAQWSVVGVLSALSYWLMHGEFPK